MPQGQTGKKDCVQLKKMYEECFRQWYTDKFLRGEKGDGCVDEWNDYKVCGLRAVRRIPVFAVVVHHTLALGLSQAWASHDTRSAAGL